MMEAEFQQEIGILQWMFRAWSRHLRLRGAIVLFIGIVFVALSFLERELFEAEVQMIYVHNSDVSLAGSLMRNAPGSMALRSLGLGELGGGVLLPEVLRSRGLVSQVLRDTVEFAGENQALYKVYSESDDSDLQAFEKTMDTFRRSYLNASYDNRTDMVRLRVLAPSPTLAADVANRMTELLNDRLIENTTRRAGQQRSFIEDRLKSVNEDLHAAELALRDFRQENRAIQASPSLRMEESRLIRKIVLNEQVFTTLTAQYELARIEELKNLPVIDIIDAAVPPLRKAMPHRSIRLITGLLLALIGIGVWDAVRFWRATQLFAS